VGVLAGETQDQLAERALERRSPCPPLRVRPAARDKLAVPAQQRVRFDREVRPRRSRYCATERGEQRSVSPGQPGPSRLTPKNRKLVTQEQDLELLRTTRPCQQPHQREQIPHHEIDERPEQAAPSSTDGKSSEPNEPDAHPEPRTSLRTLRGLSDDRSVSKSMGVQLRNTSESSPKSSGDDPYPSRCEPFGLVW
jgi:hypothetical protein